MIIITLTQDGVATIASPQRLFQGTDSEKILVLSPFSKTTCPVFISATLPSGENAGYVPMQRVQTALEAMTNIPLPEVYEGYVSAWVYNVPISWTANFGDIAINLLVQQQEDPELYETAPQEYHYRNLTSCMVQATIEEAMTPELVGVDPSDETAVAVLTRYVNSLAEEVNNISGDLTGYVTESELETALSGYVTSMQLSTTLGSYATKTEVQTGLAGKQNTLTFDDSPTAGSNNPVKSGGVKTAIDDAKTAAENYAKNYTDGQVSTIPKFAIQVVQTLPTTNISSTTVYLVPSSDAAANNLYTEWIYVNGSWEKLGTQDLDLSGYVTDTELSAALAGKQNTLTFDNTPTAGSNNPVKSKGIKSYVDDAEAAAKSYADGLSFQAGGGTQVYVNNTPAARLDFTSDPQTQFNNLDTAIQGATTVYEDGVQTPTLRIPKIYNSIAEVDALFNRSTTLHQLIDAMSDNSILIADVRKGQPTGNLQPVYAGLLPDLNGYSVSGHNGTIKVTKKTTQITETLEKVVSVSAEYTECLSCFNRGGNYPSDALSGRDVLYVRDKIAYTGDGYKYSILPFDKNGGYSNRVPIGLDNNVRWKKVVYVSHYTDDYDVYTESLFFVGYNSSNKHLTVSKYTILTVHNALQNDSVSTEVGSIDWTEEYNINADAEMQVTTFVEKVSAGNQVPYLAVACAEDNTPTNYYFVTINGSTKTATFSSSAVPNNEIITSIVADVDFSGSGGLSNIYATVRTWNGIYKYDVTNDQISIFRNVTADGVYEAFRYSNSTEVKYTAGNSLRYMSTDGSTDTLIFGIPGDYVNGLGRIVDYNGAVASVEYLDQSINNTRSKLFVVSRNYVYYAYATDSNGIGEPYYKYLGRGYPYFWTHDDFYSGSGELLQFYGCVGDGGNIYWVKSTDNSSSGGSSGGAGTTVSVNGTPQSTLSFTSDPQTQITDNTTAIGTNTTDIATKMLDFSQDGGELDGIDLDTVRYAPRSVSGTAATETIYNKGWYRVKNCTISTEGLTGVYGILLITSYKNKVTPHANEIPICVRTLIRGHKLWQSSTSYSSNQWGSASWVMKLSTDDIVDTYPIGNIAQQKVPSLSLFCESTFTRVYKSFLDLVPGGSPTREQLVAGMNANSILIASTDSSNSTNLGLPVTDYGTFILMISEQAEGAIALWSTGTGDTYISTCLFNTSLSDIEFTPWVNIGGGTDVSLDGTPQSTLALTTKYLHTIDIVIDETTIRSSVVFSFISSRSTAYTSINQIYGDIPYANKDQSILSARGTVQDKNNSYAYLGPVIGVRVGGYQNNVTNLIFEYIYISNGALGRDDASTLASTITFNADLIQPILTI